MRADHVLGSLGERGNLVDIKGRGIRGQDRAGLHRRIEGLEDGFLDLHVLEDRLDHDVGLRQVCVSHGGFDQRHALLDLFLRHAAFFRSVFVVAADGGHAAIECFLLHFEQDHRDAGVDEVHGDAAAHRAGADDCGRFDRTLGGVVWHIRNLARRALREKGMPQRLGAHRLDQLVKERALDFHAFVEGLLDRGLDAFETLHRRGITAIGLVDMVARSGKKGVDPTRHRIGRHRAIAQSRALRPVGDHLAGKGRRTGQQISIGERIEVAELERFFGTDRIAGDDHVERLGCANRPRQTLGATRTRQQAEVDFRQADLGARQTDTVVASQGQFVAATQRQACHRGDHRLGGVFDQTDQVVKAGLGKGLGRIELADIGAAREGARCAGQHDGGDGGLGQRTADAGIDTDAKIESEAVNRRIVHRDDGDIAILAIVGLSHVGFLDEIERSCFLWPVKSELAPAVDT